MMFMIKFLSCSGGNVGQSTRVKRLIFRIAENRDDRRLA